MRQILAVLALGAALMVSSPLVAGPRPLYENAVLHIEGMQPLVEDDLRQFVRAANNLALSSKTDGRVEPILLALLGQSDRGIVKRAIALLALESMGQADEARAKLGDEFRDQAVLEISQACRALPPRAAAAQ